MEVLGITGMAFFIYIGGSKVLVGTMDAGSFISLTVALGMVLNPMRRLIDTYNTILVCSAAASRIFEYMDTEPENIDDPDAIEMGPLQEKIVFKDVSFSYNGTDTVLDHINLEIMRNQVVALVGPSGAGKSTLVNLLPRFYEVGSGAILIDGVDIRRLRLSSLRRQIGIVSQETLLFNTTIRENIMYGKPGSTEDEVIRAAKAANAHEFIMRLPKGYDTIIGEAGALLSGGERQRIAIARAIIRNPSILILDEATSSLDSESERAIRAALDSFMRSRTTLVIAHRLSTVLNADLIVVMENGRIVERGTHRELYDMKGLYRRLYDTQFSTSEPHLAEKG